MALMAVPTHRGGLADAAQQSLRALCPLAIRRWRAKRHFLKNGEIELRLVRTLCHRHRDAIDVGANEGAYLHFMIGHARRVLAYEPVPWLAAALRQDFGYRVIVKDIALSRETGTAVLRMPMVEGTAITGLASLATAPGGRCCEMSVSTGPLDANYNGDAGFMKIDVEGHEEAVLDGAERTIRRCRPRILVEMEERFAPGVVTRGRERFRRMDYRGFFIHDRQIKPIERFDPATLQRPEDIATFTGAMPRSACAGYVNNFLFLPEEDCARILPVLESTLAGLAPPA